MAFIRGDRQQMSLLPQAVEDYVPASDPVRAYDAFVEALNFPELGFDLSEDQLGPPEFDPRTMLKLLIYAYSYGLRSSRKIERACYHNIGFIWLTGNLRPDHKTICRFRRDHRPQISAVLKQCARLCLKLDLIEGNTLFVDGTKIKANASMDKSWSQDRCDRLLKETDRRIDKLLAEIDELDQKEEYRDSLVQMKKDLTDKQALKSKVQAILQELKENGRDNMNTTDPECAKVKSKQSFESGYNMQAVVDEKNGLIVHTDVTHDANDLGQFEKQVNEANNIIGGTCQTACADAGYANTELLGKIDGQGIRVVVPSQRQALKGDRPFGKEKFIYDEKRDVYLCPAGQVLSFIHQDKVARRYQPAAGVCLACPFFGTCTESPPGRIVGRLHLERLKEKLETQYQQSRHIFQKRKEKAEHPFGHIKRNLGVQSFLLRGLAGVNAEASLLATCFNLTRIITILGVDGFFQQLRSSG